MVVLDRWINFGGLVSINESEFLLHGPASLDHTTWLIHLQRQNISPISEHLPLICRNLTQWWTATRPVEFGWNLHLSGLQATLLGDEHTMVEPINILWGTTGSYGCGLDVTTSSRGWRSCYSISLFHWKKRLAYVDYNFRCLKELNGEKMNRWTAIK